MPPRRIEDADIGFKVLVEGGPDPLQDVIAVHGRGAHPNDTWCQLREAGLDPTKGDNYVNWLSDETMLPQVLPRARILRYGYRSAWFGKDSLITSPKEISTDMLRDLTELRKTCQHRPLIIIAHSFGGLVVMQMLVTAFTQYTDIYKSIVGIVFFGTPFRGNGTLSQTTLVLLAQQLPLDDQQQPVEVYERQLETSEIENPYLQTLFSDFLSSLSDGLKPKIACFYEQKKTNLAVVVNKKAAEKYVLWVNAASATIDHTDKAIQKYPRDRDHLSLNKYNNASFQDFQTLAGILKAMASDGPRLIEQRNSASIDYRLTLSHKMGLTGIFLAREQELQLIQQHLAWSNKSRKVATLYGRGGIGKTHLAAAFARHNQKRYSSILSLAANSHDTLVNDFRRVAKQILRQSHSVASLASLDIDEETWKVINAVKAWLSIADNNKWLIIFDYVDVPKIAGRTHSEALDIEQYFPEANHGAIIITTRSPQVQLGNLIQVGKMAELQDAIQVLEHSSGSTDLSDDPDAMQLAKQLDGLPLALYAVGRYINRSGIEFKAYLHKFNLLFDAAPQRSPAVAAAENRILLSIWQSTFVLFKPYRRDAMTRTLLAAVHSNDDDNLQFNTGICDLAQSYTKIETKLEAQDLWYRARVTYLQAYGTSDKRRLKTELAAAICLSDSGQFNEAKEIFESTRRAAVQAYGGSSLLAIDAQSGLARVHFRQNELVAAEKMFREVVASYVEILGMNDVSTLRAVNDVARTCLVQSKYDEAEVLLLRVTTSPRFDQTPMLLEANLGLSTVYAHHKRWPEAEAVLKHSMSCRQRRVGEGGKDAINAAFQLGDIYIMQKKSAEAIDIILRAMRWQEQARSPLHWLRAQLGCAYRLRGDHQQAESLFAQASASYGLAETTLSEALTSGEMEMKYSANNSWMLATRAQLGIIYFRQRRQEEARSCFDEAVLGYDRMRAIEQDMVAELRKMLFPVRSEDLPVRSAA